MGVYGYSIDIISSLNYSTGIHAMYSGIDWLYTHVETLYIYDYKIIYFHFLNSIYEDSIDFFLHLFGFYFYKQQQHNYYGLFF